MKMSEQEMQEFKEFKARKEWLAKMDQIAEICRSASPKIYYRRRFSESREGGYSTKYWACSDPALLIKLVAEQMGLVGEIMTDDDRSVRFYQEGTTKAKQFDAAAFKKEQEEKRALASRKAGIYNRQRDFLRAVLTAIDKLMALQELLDEPGFNNSSTNDRIKALLIDLKAWKMFVTNEEPLVSMITRAYDYQEAEKQKKLKPN